MLGDISSELRIKMGMLKGEMESLLGGGWQGKAAQGFAEGWEQWQAGAHEVLEALDQMGQQLHATGRDYGLIDDGSADKLWESGEGL